MLLGKRIKAIDVSTTELSNITSGSFFKVIKLSTGRLIGLGNCTLYGHPRSGNVPAINTEYQIGIWYSDNDGETWTQSSKTDGRFKDAIELSNGDLLALGYYTSITMVNGGNGQYNGCSTCISFDKGEHWQEITTNWKYDSVVETASGNIVLASSYAIGNYQTGTYSYGTYYPSIQYISINDIRTSTTLTPATGLGSNGKHVVGLDTITGKVYVYDLRNYKLYVSVDEGITFTEVQNNGLPNLSKVQFITIGNNFFIISSTVCYKLNRANNIFEALTFDHYITKETCYVANANNNIAAVPVFPYNNGYIIPLTNKINAYTEDGENFEYIDSNVVLDKVLMISNNKIIENEPSTDTTYQGNTTTYYHGVAKASITQLPDIVYNAKYKYLDQAGLQEIHNQMMDYISEVTQ